MGKQGTLRHGEKVRRERNGEILKTGRQRWGDLGRGYTEITRREMRNSDKEKAVRENKKAREGGCPFLLGWDQFSVVKSELRGSRRHLIPKHRAFPRLPPGQGAAPHPSPPPPVRPRPRGPGSDSPPPARSSPYVPSVFGRLALTLRQSPTETASHPTLQPGPPGGSPGRSAPSPGSHAAGLRGNRELNDAATCWPDLESTACLEGWARPPRVGIPRLLAQPVSAGSFQESGWACSPAPHLSWLPLCPSLGPRD